MKNSITIKNSSPMVSIIEIEGAIGEQTQGAAANYEGFRAQLDQIKALDCEHIRVNIRSCGGDLNDALLIHQALCESEATVETHCYGYVASAATVIAQAASEGLRFVSSGSLYLIHNASMATQGNKNDVRRTVELLEKSDEQIAELYALRSGVDKQGFLELMSQQDGKGRWLTAQEAVGFGLADQIETVSPLKKIQRKIQNFFSSFADRESVQMQGVQHSPMVENSNYFVSQDTLGRRANIYPTTTLEREDPEVMLNNPIVISTRNQFAYNQDLETFSQI